MSEIRKFTWTSAVLSDVGKVRTVNEDAGEGYPEKGLWVVADGMGGHSAGDVASKLIVRAMAEVGQYDQPGDLVDDVEDRLMQVNHRLFTTAASAEQPVTIGSTVVVMLAFGGHGLFVWAGDSRAYCLRDGALRQVTRDHSQVEELIDKGEILREDAESHPLANVITRAVGGAEELFLDLELVELEDGDRYLLCSDGLYKDLTEDDIAERLRSGDCEQACRRLVDTVLERQAADNVTVAVVDFREWPPQ